MGLWDVRQQIQIRGLQSAQRLNDQASDIRHQRNDRRSDELEDRFERLAAVTEALWTLVRDRLQLTDEQLEAAVQEVLAQDPMVDGKRVKVAAKCTTCGAAVPPGMPRCQFCGADAPDNGDAFDSL